MFIDGFPECWGWRTEAGANGPMGWSWSNARPSQVLPGMSAVLQAFILDIFPVLPIGPLHTKHPNATACLKLLQAIFQSKHAIPSAIPAPFLHFSPLSPIAPPVNTMQKKATEAHSVGPLVDASNAGTCTPFTS